MRMTGAEQAVRCWACGSAAVAPTDRLAPAAYLRCDGCGLSFAPARDAQALVASHDDEYFANFGNGRGYETQAAQLRWEVGLRLRWVRRYASHGHLLDVGCASGVFLEAARAAGFAVRGVEPSAGVAAAARERGLDVLTGTLEDLPEEMAGLDVATGWHVLEHIPGPLDALAGLRRRLRPGGHLLLEVPNAESVVAERDGGGWHLADVDHHVSQYGPSSLRELLERAGFEVLDLYTFPFPAYWRPRHWIDPRYWRELAAMTRTIRTNPLRRHASAHELLRAVARA